MSETCFLFAGGGTGGHLAPGIAVAEELRLRDPSCRCVFVGSGRAVEQRLLAGTGFESVSLSAQSLRQLARHPLQFVTGNLAALRDAVRLIRQHRPRAVVGLGGYASVAIVIAAGLAGVPVWLLEQNAIPGRANRWLSYWFPVCVTFDRSASWLPLKARVYQTGNPLRRSLIAAFRSSLTPPSQRGCDLVRGIGFQPVEIAAEDDRLEAYPTNGRMLLVMGGSQGSTPVNRAVLTAIRRLRPLFEDWRIVHQTGESDCESVRRAYAELGLSCDVQPFFADVPTLYSESACIICRAGATTLTELAAAGLPSILIPYPFAADQHQVENSRVFEDAGAAEVVIERDPASTADELQTRLARLIRSPERLDAMSVAMRRLARWDAASDVADLLLADASDGPLRRSSDD